MVLAEAKCDSCLHIVRLIRYYLSSILDEQGYSFHDELLVVMYLQPSYWCDLARKHEAMPWCLSVSVWGCMKVLASTTIFERSFIFS